jgi:hypothetical protein
MKDLARKAVQAAIDFLNNDEARDLLGLHKIRVGSELMTRGQVADMLQATLSTTAAPLPPSKQLPRYGDGE